MCPCQHQLTKHKQGEYHYTIGPYAEPVLSMKSGDTVVVETMDSFGNKLINENIKSSDIEKLPFVNPVNGPIYIDGAKKGDALKITIEAIIPIGEQPRGSTCLVPYFGGLTGTEECPTLHEPLPELVRKVVVTTDEVKWNDKISFPYQPFIGTIGTSPLIDSINTLTPGKHGGNMDLSDVCPGNILYLPVQADGGLLYLGDCHAVQGDGELCGVAIEIASYTTLKIEIINGWELEWPRLESADYIMSIASIRPMENAARIAYHDLIQWMVQDFGFDKWEAYFILTQIGKVHLGNMVNPNYTLGASIEKKYLL